MGRKTAWGKEFRENSILRILTNEKLVGDLELQKYIMKDFLQHTARPNRGEAPKYYVRDHHAGIVDRTTWEMVQALMRKDRCGWNRVHGETADWEQYRVGKKVVNRVDRRSGALGNPFVCIHCKGGCGADIRYRVEHRSRIAGNYIPEPLPEGPYEAVQTYTCLVCESCNRTKCPTGYLYSAVLEQEYMRLLYRLRDGYRKNGSQSELEIAWRAVLKERQEHKDWYEAHEEKRRVLESELAKLETAREQMEDKKHRNGTEFAKQRTTELIQALSEGSISFDDLEVRVEYGINCIVLKDEARGSKGQRGDQILAMTEELLMDIEKRITEKRQKLRELEDSCLREDFMKKYYALFLKYLLLLTDTQPDGTAIDPERQLLPFERGMFTAFILDGELDGDSIRYRTRFGVELVCGGAEKTLDDLTGLIRFREDGSSIKMKEVWQITDELPKIRKKRRWSQADIEKYGKETNE